MAKCHSMQLVKSLDLGGSALNNEDAMFKRAAKRVKDWRKDHALNQIAFAELARVSVGCLQGFESGGRDTRKSNVGKIAAVLGLTKDELLSDDDSPLDKPNPLLKDLRTDDLRLANHFHHADADTKHAVKAFLSPTVADDQRERVARLLEQLLRLEGDLLLAVEQFLLELHDDGQREEKK